ncbi:hypothetical protein AAG747_07640 [Rapidithrix thailandica]|uniref:Anti-sigma factor n=1 Tax=Rapidithrix thailandica TaxID=413964 RepID=A0AAW9S7R9_9BACT
MTTKISATEILKYLYKEVSEEEKRKFEEKLKNDAQFQEEFYSFLHLKKELDGLEKAPSEKSIQKILDFSKSFDLKKSIK